MYETLEVTVDSGAATVLLNRPDKLNAINKTMMMELRQVADELDERNDVRVVVLRGAGARAFSAGADLAWSEELTPADRVEHGRLGHRTFDRIERMEMPVIAAIHGYALGGGLELALAADFIVCSASAQMGLPEITLSADPPYRPKITEDGDPDQPEFGGAIPGWGGPRRLPERVGKALAKELIYTGIRVDAARAVQIGLANHAFPDDTFDEEVAELARRIGAMNRYNLRLAKETISRGFDILEGHPS